MPNQRSRQLSLLPTLEEMNATHCDLHGHEWFLATSQRIECLTCCETHSLQGLTSPATPCHESGTLEGGRVGPATATATARQWTQDDQDAYMAAVLEDFEQQEMTNVH